jgi:hypothetical protein
VAHQYGNPPWAVAPAPGLSIVDRVFLLTHDTNSGKAQIALDLIGVGLAGAALLELTMSSSVTVKHSTEIVRVTQYQHHDEAAQYVLTRIYESEPTLYATSDWITVLRNELYLGVAGTLVKRGLIDEHRSSLRGARYIPRRRDAAEESLAWVYGLLQSPRRAADAGERAVLLACLAGALGVAATITALPASEIASSLPTLVGRCNVQDALIVKEVQRAATKLAVTPRR